MRRLKKKKNNFPFIETQGKLGQSPQTSSEFQHSLNSVLFFYYHYTFFVLQYQISLAWEFLCVPSEGFCYLHTRQEAAAASSFHSWCTATHQERLGCLFFFFFYWFPALGGQFFTPIFSPCSQAESIHHPKSVSRPKTLLASLRVFKKRSDGFGGRKTDRSNSNLQRRRSMTF